MDLELLDQGKQTKPTHVQEAIRKPPRFWKIYVNGKGVMEIRNSGSVPGVTGKGACAETVVSRRARRLGTFGFGRTI
jgi:hypothetical protein